MSDYLQKVQHYLESARTPDHSEVPGPASAPSSATSWIAASGQPKVPVDVAASGPRVLALGARLAERVTVNVGAEPDRISWALETAHAARRRFHPGGPPLSVGAYLVTAAHADADVARRLVSGPLAAYARFSGMPGSPKSLLSEPDRAVIEALSADYDFTAHGRPGARHTRHLDRQFVDRFAVAGTPEHCANRLAGLAALGLDRVVLVEGLDPSQHDQEAAAHQLFTGKVLPVLRGLSS